MIQQARGKRKFELGRQPIETKQGIEKKKIVRTKGGNQKIKLFSGNSVNVVDKDGKIKNVPIKRVTENQSSVDYDRRSIITKGAILETEIGYVKVTSRPGQDGQINGALTDYKPKK
ncbi:MAG: 30S ribosomal protein S8e [archaeon]|nr:30S ribosomal protein S8e [archaeon]